MGATVSPGCLCASEGGDCSSDFGKEPIADSGSSSSVIQTFTVQLTRREGSGFGVVVDAHPRVDFLTVAALATASAVAEWNRHHPDKEVLLGDRVVEVNGFSGDAAALLKNSVGCGQLTLTVLRVTPGGHEAVAPVSSDYFAMLGEPVPKDAPKRLGDFMRTFSSQSQPGTQSSHRGHPPHEEEADLDLGPPLMQATLSSSTPTHSDKPASDGLEQHFIVPLDSYNWNPQTSMGSMDSVPEGTDEDGESLA